MTTTTTKAAAKPAKPAKAAKPTAAERRAAETADRERRKQEFDAARPAHFGALFAKALRIDALRREDGYEELLSSNDWWFEHLQVDARKASFTCEETGGRHAHTEENLCASDVERLHRSLDMALEWFKEHDEAQERKRQEAEALRARQRAALAKLTPQDIKDLGVEYLR